MYTISTIVMMAAASASIAQFEGEGFPILPAAPAPIKKRWETKDVGFQVGFSSDGQAYYTLREENQGTHLVVWDLRTGRRLRAHRLPFKDFTSGSDLRKALSDGGRFFVCEPGGDKGSTLLAIDLQTGRERSWDMSKFSDARGLAIDAEGKISRFNAFFSRHSLDFKTGTVVDHAPEVKALDAKFVSRRYYDYRFRTPDGKYEGYWGALKEHAVVIVAERETKKDVLTIPGFWGGSPVLSPDGKTLIVPTSRQKFPQGKGDRFPFNTAGQMELWNLPELKRIATIPWRTVEYHTNRFGAKFSPDSQQVALWYEAEEENRDPTIQIWDVRGKRLGSLEVRPRANEARYSPDGKIIFAFEFGGDYAMHAYDAASLRLLWRLPNQPAHLPVFYTSDGRQFVMTRDYALQWRDVETGKVTKAVSSNAPRPETKPIAGGRYLAVRDYRRADGKPFALNDPDFGEGTNLLFLTRVIDRETAREVFRCEVPGYTECHVPADGRTLIQVTLRNRELIWDMTCWELAAPDK